MPSSQDLPLTQPVCCFSLSPTISATSCARWRRQLIALWDGGGGDSPGGTADLVERAKSQSGREPEIIDPKDLIQQQE
jgi:hypothetical protein